MMDGHSLRRHRSETAEIGRMYLLVVALFLAGLVLWELGQLHGTPWELRASDPPSQALHYGR